jgi:hypothetical protein
MTNGEIVLRGAIGSGASLGAAIFTPDMESNLRGVSLCVGIVVGLVTIWKLMRKAKNEA